MEAGKSGVFGTHVRGAAVSPGLGEGQSLQWGPPSGCCSQKGPGSQGGVLGSLLGLLRPWSPWSPNTASPAASKAEEEGGWRRRGAPAEGAQCRAGQTADI